MGPLKSMKYGAIVKAIYDYSKKLQNYGKWPIPAALALSHRICKTNPYKLHLYSIIAITSVYSTLLMLSDLTKLLAKII